MHFGWRWYRAHSTCTHKPPHYRSSAPLSAQIQCYIRASGAHTQPRPLSLIAIVKTARKLRTDKRAPGMRCAAATHTILHTVEKLPCCRRRATSTHANTRTQHASHAGCAMRRVCARADIDCERVTPPHVTRTSRHACA